MDARSAVVTGGGTGIGRAIALQLAGEGYDVLIAGRRREVLERCVADVAAAVTGAQIGFAVADLATAEGAQALADAAGERFEVLDLLVNNAGGSDHRPIDSLADLVDKWTGTVAQNLVSAVITTYALKPMLRRPGARVVTIGSKSARGGGGDAAYASSKAAINRWNMSLATELGAEGITANVVSPGFVPDTELYGPGGADPSWSGRVASGIAVGRVGLPSDVAHAVSYLASEAASWVSGTVFDVDGGVRLAL